MVRIDGGARAARLVPVRDLAEDRLPPRASRLVFLPHACREQYEDERIGQLWNDLEDVP